MSSTTTPTPSPATPLATPPDDEKKSRSRWMMIIGAVLGGGLGIFTGGIGGAIIGLLTGLMGGFAAQEISNQYGKPAAGSNPTAPTGLPAPGVPGDGKDGPAGPDQSTLLKDAQKVFAEGQVVDPNNPYDPSNPASRLKVNDPTVPTLAITGLAMALQRGLVQPRVNGLLEFTRINPITRWVTGKLGTPRELGLRNGLMPGLWATPEGIKENAIKALEDIKAREANPKLSAAEKLATKAEAKAMKRATGSSAVKGLMNGTRDIDPMRARLGAYYRENPTLLRQFWNETTGLTGAPVEDIKVTAPTEPGGAPGVVVDSGGDVIRITPEGRSEFVDPKSAPKGVRVSYSAAGESATYILDPELELGKFTEKFPELKASVRAALIEEATVAIKAHAEKMPTGLDRHVAQARAVAEATVAIDKVLSRPAGAPQDVSVRSLRTSVSEIIKTNTGITPAPEPVPAAVKPTAPGATPTEPAAKVPEPVKPATAPEPAATKPVEPAKIAGPELKTATKTGFDSASGKEVTRTIYTIDLKEKGKALIAVEKADPAYGENIYRSTTKGPGGEYQHYSVKDGAVKPITPSKAAFNVIDLSGLEEGFAGRVEHQLSPVNEPARSVSPVPAEEGLGANIFRDENGRYFRAEKLPGAADYTVTETTATLEVRQLEALRNAGLKNANTITDVMKTLTDPTQDPAVRAMRGKLSPEQLKVIAQEYDAALTRGEKPASTYLTEKVTQAGNIPGVQPETTPEPAAAAKPGKPVNPLKPTAAGAVAKLLVTEGSMVDADGKTVTNRTFSMMEKGKPVSLELAPAEEGIGNNVYRTKTTGAAEPTYYRSTDGELTPIKKPATSTFSSTDIVGGGVDTRISIEGRSSIEVFKVKGAAVGLGEEVYSSQDGSHIYRVLEGKKADGTPLGGKTVSEITTTPEGVRASEILRMPHGKTVMEHLTETLAAKDIKPLAEKLSPAQVKEIAEMYSKALEVESTGGKTAGNDFLAKKITGVASREPVKAPETVPESVKPAATDPLKPTAATAARPSPVKISPTLVTKSTTSFDTATGKEVSTTSHFVDPKDGTAPIAVEKVPASENLGQNTYRTKAAPGRPQQYFSGESELKPISRPMPSDFTSADTSALGGTKEFTLRPVNEAEIPVVKVPPEAGLGEGMFKNAEGTRFFRVNEGAPKGQQVTEVTKAPELSHLEPIRTLQLANPTEVMAHISETFNATTHADVLALRGKLSPEQIQRLAVEYDKVLEAGKATGTKPPHDFLTTRVRAIAAEPATVVTPAAATGAAIKPNTWGTKGAVNQRGGGWGMHIFATGMGAKSLNEQMSEYRKLDPKDPAYEAKAASLRHDMYISGGMTGMGGSGMAIELASARQMANVQRAVTAGTMDASALSRVTPLTRASGGLGVAGGGLTIIQGYDHLKHAKDEDTEIGKNAATATGWTEIAAGSYFTGAGVATVAGFGSAGWVAAAGPIGVVLIGVSIYSDLVVGALKDCERASTEFSTFGRITMSARAQPAVNEKGYNEFITQLKPDPANPSKEPGMPKLSMYKNLTTASHAINELARSAGPSLSDPSVNKMDFFLDESASPEQIRKSIDWARKELKAVQEKVIADNGFNRDEVLDAKKRADKMIDVQKPDGWWWLPVYSAYAAGKMNDPADIKARRDLGNGLLAIDSSEMALASLVGAEKEVFGEEDVGSGSSKGRAFRVRQQTGIDTFQDVTRDIGSLEKENRQPIRMVSYASNYETIKNYNLQRAQAAKKVADTVKQDDLPTMSTDVKILTPWTQPGGERIEKDGKVTFAHGYESIGNVELKYTPEMMARITAHNEKAVTLRKRFDDLEQKILARIEVFERDAIVRKTEAEHTPQGMTAVPDHVKNGDFYKNKLAKRLADYKGVQNSGPQRAAAVRYILEDTFANAPKMRAIINDTALTKELDHYRIAVAGDAKDPSAKSFKQETVELEKAMLDEQVRINREQFEAMFDRAATKNAKSWEGLLTGKTDGKPDPTRARVLKADDKAGGTMLAGWLNKDEEVRVLAKAHNAMKLLQEQGKKNIHYNELGLEDRELAIIYNIRKARSDSNLYTRTDRGATTVNGTTYGSYDYVFYENMPAVVFSASQLANEDLLSETLATSNRNAIVAQNDFLTHLEKNGVADPKQAKFIKETEASANAFVDWAKEITDAAIERQRLASTPEQREQADREREMVDQMIETRQNLERNYQTFVLAYGRNEFDGRKFNPLQMLYADKVQEGSLEMYDPATMQKRFIDTLSKLNPETARKIVAANAKLNAAGGHLDVQTDTMALPTNDNIPQLAQKSAYKTRTEFRHKSLVITGLASLGDGKSTMPASIILGQAGEYITGNLGIFASKDRDDLTRLVQAKYDVTRAEAEDMVDKVSQMFTKDARTAQDLTWNVIDPAKLENAYEMARNHNTLMTAVINKFADENKPARLTIETTFKAIAGHPLEQQFLQFLEKTKMPKDLNSFYNFTGTPEFIAYEKKYNEEQAAGAKAKLEEFMKTDPVVAGYEKFRIAKGYQGNTMDMYIEYANTPGFEAIIEQRTTELADTYKRLSDNYRKVAGEYFDSPEMKALKVNDPKRYEDAISDYHRFPRTPAPKQEWGNAGIYLERVKEFKKNDAAIGKLPAELKTKLTALAALPSDVKLLQAKAFLGLTAGTESQDPRLVKGIDMAVNHNGKLINGATIQYAPNSTAYKFYDSSNLVPVLGDDRLIASLTGIDTLVMKQGQAVGGSYANGDQLDEFAKLGFTQRRMRILESVSAQLTKEFANGKIPHVKEDVGKRLERVNALITQWKAPGKQLLTAETKVMDGNTTYMNSSTGYAQRNTDVNNPLAATFITVDQMANKLLSNTKDGTARYGFAEVETFDYGTMVTQTSNAKIPSDVMLAALKLADQKIQKQIKETITRRTKGVDAATDAAISGLDVTKIRASLKAKEEKIDADIVKVKDQIAKFKDEAKELVLKKKALEMKLSDPDEKVKAQAAKDIEALDERAENVDTQRSLAEDKLTRGWRDDKDGKGDPEDVASLESQKADILVQYDAGNLTRQRLELINDKAFAEDSLLYEMHRVREFRQQTLERYGVNLAEGDQLLTEAEVAAMNTAAASAVIHMSTYIDDLKKYGIVERKTGMTDEQYDDAVYEEAKYRFGNRIESVSKAINDLELDGREYDLTADQKRAIGNLIKFSDRYSDDMKHPETKLALRNSVAKVFGTQDFVASANTPAPAVGLTAQTTQVGAATMGNESLDIGRSLLSLLSGTTKPGEQPVSGTFRPDLPSGAVKKPEKGQLT